MGNKKDTLETSSNVSEPIRSDGLQTVHLYYYQSDINYTDKNP